jgi:biotin synthase-like enzyme
MKKEVIENVHYYLENGRVVFTTLFHLQRGSCCGNKCRHCPYSPQYEKGNTKTEDKDFIDSN